MAVITIRELGQAETGFNATLVIEGNNYQITVSDPFGATEEQELEWYFEQWLHYPILEQVKADRAAASVKKYGQELFKQVFQADNNAYSQYSQLRGNLSQIQIEIESITPEFHAIHWEALQDPDLPFPLAIDSVLIRKSVRPAIIEAQVKQFPTVNLLVVTARPGAERDVGYRTISRPLVEAIRNSQLRVKVELLRPGTYEALARHLESKGSGYYHIVHFDVHGALKTYQDFEKGVESNRYIYSGRYGRGQIKEYTGKRAFLALEGESKGKYDLVEAQEIANLLTGKGIPVCILNACQSGKQLNQVDAEDNRETSLGSRLMNAGMQMVVAMSYSVTVTAAEIMMEQIYQHLFDRQDINQAIRLGRKELYNRRGRRASYNTEIDLEDWLLPVTYCNGQVNFNLRAFTPEEEEAYYLSLDSKYEFPQPTYGFVGRDLDILLIEKALLKHNILLLQGMGGTGKTTLLNYLREWWQVTNFAEDIFYFGYDVKAHTLQQIVYQIGQQVYNRFEQANFQAMNLTAQWRKLSQKLRAEAYILILDNLESVTGQPLAIQNTLDEPAREEIKQFIASLVGGKTKVVLGSRISEQWLQESTFRDNSYQLKGLDIQARTDLAEKILQRVNSSKSLDEIKTDKHFQRLMNLLAGYPLAMEVILVNLKQQSPQEILEQLEKAEIHPGGEDKTNNILKCIEYSHSNLSESSQKLLLLLAPFRKFIFTLYIPQYIEELAKYESFKNYELKRLESVIKEAVNWSLLTSIDKNLPSELLDIQPLLPYFLQTKLLKTDEITQISLQKGFKNHYLNLGNMYSNLLQSKKPHEKQMGLNFVKWEYENFYQALQFCLENEERFFGIWNCLANYLKLINNYDEQIQLTQLVYNKLSLYNNKYPEQSRDIIAILGNLGNYYRNNRNYQKAFDTYKNILDLIPKLNQLDNKNKQWDMAITYHQLGLISKNKRDYDNAKVFYNQAIAIYEAINEPYETGGSFLELGIVFQQLREYVKAAKYYQKALEIFIKYDDLYSQALVNNHLGNLAQELQRFQESENYYQTSLIIKNVYGDRFSQAHTLQGLGTVALQLREYQQARECFQQALDIYIEYSNRFSQAITFHNLGRVAQELREYQQAREYYQQALDIYIEYGDLYEQGRTLYQLGSVAQELREYQQAREYYQQALDIFIEYSDHFSQASTLHQLGTVAQELREYQQARGYYQQALDIYIEYGDLYEQAVTYGQLGILAEELSELEQAKNYYLQTFEIFVKFEDGEYLGLLVISKLADLYQKTGNNSILVEVAAMLKITESEVKELFEKFNAENQ